MMVRTRKPPKSPPQNDCRCFYIIKIRAARLQRGPWLDASALLGGPSGAPLVVPCPLLRRGLQRLAAAGAGSRPRPFSRAPPGLRAGRCPLAARRPSGRPALPSGSRRASPCGRPPPAPASLRRLSPPAPRRAGPRPCGARGGPPAGACPVPPLAGPPSGAGPVPVPPGLRAGGGPPPGGFGGAPPARGRSRSLRSLAGGGGRPSRFARLASLGRLCRRRARPALIFALSRRLTVLKL